MCEMFSCMDAGRDLFGINVRNRPFFRSHQQKRKLRFDKAAHARWRGIVKGTLLNRGSLKTIAESCGSSLAASERKTVLSPCEFAPAIIVGDVSDCVAGTAKSETAPTAKSCLKSGIRGQLIPGVAASSQPVGPPETHNSGLLMIGDSFSLCL